MDAIFTISVVMCNRRLHRSKQFGLKRHGKETDGKHDCIKRINSRSSWALVRGQRGDGRHIYYFGDEV